MKGGNILIIGGAGFIGSHLAPFLVKKGYSVTVMDLKRKPSFFPDTIFYVKGDARDKRLVQRYLKDVDICFHLAAVFGGSQFIHDNAAEILKTNTELLISVFEAAAESNLQRIIFPSSGLVYNERLTIPVAEDDLFNYPPTQNPYGMAKLLGERFCYAYWQERQLPFSIVRMFNVYGPGDTHDHVIPNFVKKILSGKSLDITGDGSGSRVFTYIDDILDGLLRVAESSAAKNEVFNLSSEGEVRLIDLGRMIWKIADCKGELPVTYHRIIGFTPDRRAVSAEKIRSLLGWEAQIPLEKGLREVIRWIKTLEK